MLAEQEVEAAEPVRQHEQDVDEVDDAPQVGVDGAGLHHVVVVVHAVGLEEAGEAQDGVDAHVELQQVQRQQRAQVEQKGAGLHVVPRQLG